MTGNVWEWLDDPLRDHRLPCLASSSSRGSRCGRIIGGAFNTYFPSEATCQFITGQGELDRRENIGFRCARVAGPAPALALTEYSRNSRVSPGTSLHLEDPAMPSKPYYRNTIACTATTVAPCAEGTPTRVSHAAVAFCPGR